MDRGAWWATVHGVQKKWTRLNDLEHGHSCQQAPGMCLAWSSRRGYTVGLSDICYLSRGRGGEGLALLDQWILMWGH